MDQWAVRSLSRGHCLSASVSPFIWATYCSTYIESALLFCRRSYWGSRPLDQWCPHLPGLWTPLPLWLSPVVETDKPHEHSNQHPLDSGRTQNDNLINISQHFYFPLDGNIPLAFIIMTFSCQNACCCLRNKTPVTVRTDKRAQVKWWWMNINLTTKSSHEHRVPQWFLTRHTCGYFCSQLHERHYRDYDLNLKKYISSVRPEHPNLIKSSLHEQTDQINS